MRRAFAALPLLLFSACSDLEFRQARRLEDKREFDRAAASFERVLEKSPGGARETEVLVRLGRIYAEEFGRCERAVPLFEAAARMGAPSSRRPPTTFPMAAGTASLPAPPERGRAPSVDWPALARRALMSCPDYFPLRDGARWVFVDSQSGGANMRLDIALSRSSSTANAAGAYFAGRERFKEYRRSYEVEDFILWEGEPAGERAPILRYPYHEGLSWQARRGGKLFTYHIDAAGVSVSVMAGSFSGCLKVKSSAAGDPAWVFDYYCPGVGRVKTTVGVPEGENPNTELAESSLLSGALRGSTGSPVK